MWLKNCIVLNKFYVERWREHSIPTNIVMYSAIKATKTKILTRTQNKTNIGQCFHIRLCTLRGQYYSNIYKSGR